MRDHPLSKNGLYVSELSREVFDAIDSETAVAS